MSDQMATQRLTQGAAKWNQWSRSNPGEKIDFAKHTFDSSTNFREFVFSGPVSFKNARFAGRVDFRGARFEKDVSFQSVTFSRGARFGAVEFGGVADFRDAKFESSLDFSGAKFVGSARFNSMAVKGVALFKSVKLQGTADFSHADFQRIAQFTDSEFFLSTSFQGINSASVFSIRRNKFALVPDFTDAKFRLPPTFEDVLIANSFVSSVAEEEDPRSAFFKLVGFSIAPSRDMAARFRRLKGLAAEGHDHLSELDFFADEIRSRRFWLDSPGKMLPGLIYQWLSDFGRSIARPFVILIGLWFFSALSFFSNRAFGTGGKCQFENYPVFEALLLSLTNAVPFLGWGRTTQISRISECLYLSSQLPTGIWFGSVVQSIFSVALLFLIALGLRNRFKIK